jgi:hypothetical protein
MVKKGLFRDNALNLKMKNISLMDKFECMIFFFLDNQCILQSRQIFIHTYTKYIIKFCGYWNVQYGFTKNILQSRQILFIHILKNISLMDKFECMIFFFLDNQWVERHERHQHSREKEHLFVKPYCTFQFPQNLIIYLVYVWIKFVRCFPVIKVVSLW